MLHRIFDVYAYHGHTLDSLLGQLRTEGVTYTDATPWFSRSKLYDTMTSRVYIGEVQYQKQWYPVAHEPLIDRTTFACVQTLLGGQSYRSHDLTYAGERKTKPTKSGPKDYIYYRCAH